MSSPEPEPTLDIARGDKALSKHLKNSLDVLKNKADDPEFSALVDEIKSGRRSLRDTFTSPVFSRVLDPLVGQAAEHYENLSEEEREELARTGEQQFEEMRREEEQSAARGSEPDGPDDPDGDFDEENWLR